MYGQGKIRNDSLRVLTPSFSVQKGKDFQIVMKNAPQNSEFFKKKVLSMSQSRQKHWHSKLSQNTCQ